MHALLDVARGWSSCKTTSSAPDHPPPGLCRMSCSSQLSLATDIISHGLARLWTTLPPSTYDVCSRTGPCVTSLLMRPRLRQPGGLAVFSYYFIALPRLCCCMIIACLLCIFPDFPQIRHPPPLLSPSRSCTFLSHFTTYGQRRPTKTLDGHNIAQRLRPSLLQPQAATISARSGSVRGG